MKTELTKEESKRLIELGVDKSVASKSEYYQKIGYGCKGIFYTPVAESIFTLADLFSILPKGITVDGLDVKMRITSWVDEPYYVGYENQISEYFILNNSEELIDAVYMTIVELIEKGYLLYITNKY